MKKKAEDILKEHFKDNFGKLISQMLLEQKLKNYGIGNLEKLELEEKIHFGEKLIEDIFGDFYEADRLQNMKVLYLLRFSINEVIEKIEKMINKESDITLEKLEEPNIEVLKSLPEEFKKEENVNFCFEVSNILDGVMVFTFEKDKTIEFGMLLLEIMQGEKSLEYELDNMKLSTIYEFFNIIMPSFVEIIGKIYDMEIYYVPIYFNDFKKKYMPDENIKQPKKLLQTKSQIAIDDFKIKGDINFLIYDVSEKISKLMDRGASKESDAWEKDTPKIIVPKTNNLRKDLEVMFDMLHLSSSVIDDILSGMKESELENFNATDFIEFYQNLINNYFINATNNKKALIKANLAHILNIKV